MTLHHDVHEDQPTFEDLKILADVSRLLTLLDLAQVLQQVVDLMRERVGASRASLILQDGASIDWDHIIIRRNLDRTESIKVVRDVLDKGLAGWVVSEKRGVLVVDTRTDDRWHVFPDDPASARSVLCVPFIDGDDVVAVLTLEHPEPGHFKNHHLRVVTIVANQATVAIRNAQLFNQVQAQQRQLEAVLYSMLDPLYVLDEQRRILLTNDAALKLLGVPMAEAVGRPLVDFAAQDRALRSIIEAIDRPSNNDDFWSLGARSDNLLRDYDVTVSLWEHETHDRGGYVVVMHDVTDLKDLNRFKDDIIKMASHDLRSPLALISGYCDIIEMDTPDAESPVHGHVAEVRRAAARMNGLLDHLLRVEQIRNSPLELREEVDIEALVRAVIADAQPDVEQKQQTLRMQVALEGLPKLTADPVLVRQSMENLIGNAVKYTPEGGSIIVRAWCEERRFHFEVEDNGIGIPKEQLSRVFDSFYRAKQAGTEHIDGKGVGLHLVKTIIERHKGEVRVESEPGAGSCFGFWLPI